MQPGTSVVQRCRAAVLTPSYPRSLPPPLPLPLISTFQHTDTVTARADFHRGAHGQWAGRLVSPLPAVRTLWLSHCCTMTNWDYCRGCARRHSRIQRTSRPPASYSCGGILFLLKRALWFVPLFLAALGDGGLHCDAAGFSCRDIWSFRGEHNAWENSQRKV